MPQSEFSITIEIPASHTVVWSVIADVERWPEWTASVKRIVRLTPGPLSTGSRLRIHQPKFPPAFWRVVEAVPNTYLTTESRAPGLRVTAEHIVGRKLSMSFVTLSIRYEGLIGPLFARLTHDLNRRYLAMEANGLKKRCSELAATF